DVGRGAGRFRKTRPEFGITDAGKGGHEAGCEEGKRGRRPGLANHRPDKDIDTGADDYAETVEDQQAETENAAKTGGLDMGHRVPFEAGQVPCAKLGREPGAEPRALVICQGARRFPWPVPCVGSMYRMRGGRVGGDWTGDRPHECTGVEPRSRPPYQPISKAIGARP